LAHPLNFKKKNTKKKKKQKEKMQVESPTLQSAADSFYNAQVAIISVVVQVATPTSKGY
jgi:uncharacterized membrane protein